MSLSIETEVILMIHAEDKNITQLIHHYMIRQPFTKKY